MLNERLNLYDIVALADDYKMSYKYVNYLTNSRLQQYRHEEIRQIKSLLEVTNCSREYAANFYYSYQINRLNKEFDLLKISNSYILNIELKSVNVGYKRILKQLNQNKYYLKLTGLNVIEICYILKTNTFLFLDNNKLKEISSDEVLKYIKGAKEERNLDLETIYTIDNISASPNAAPQRFIDNDYILTENQEVAKGQIIRFLKEENSVLLIGDSGSGKTLLLYDLLKGYNKSVLISGQELTKNEKLIKEKTNLLIISKGEIKKFNFETVSYIFVDEANSLEIDDYIYLSNMGRKIVYSSDKQLHFLLDEKSDVTNLLESNVINKVKLNNKVRISNEINNFILRLFNLSKDIKIDFSKIHIRYFNSQEVAIKEAKALKDTCYIDYDLNVFYNQNNLSSSNSYYIYGKEYNKIVMILDDKFYYINNRLYSNNTKYDYKKMLNYFLSRAKKEITIFVTGKKLMKQIEKLL